MPRDWRDRLEEFSKLEDLWKDGIDGKATGVKAVEAARKCFELIEKSSPAVPHLFPNVEGGLNLENGTGDFSWSVEISEQGQKDLMLFDIPKRKAVHIDDADYIVIVDSWKEAYERNQ